MSNALKLVIVLMLSFVNIPNTQADNLKELLEKAYNNSDKIAQNKLQFQSAIEQYTSVLSRLLPSVNYTINWTNGYPQELSLSGLKQSASLSTTLPIFNGGGSIASLNSAKASVDIAKAQWYIGEQEYLLDSIKAYILYYGSVEAYKISNTSVNSTKKQYEAADARLQLGEATKTDVASAQAGYTQALAQREALYSNLVVAKLKFINLFGDETAQITSIEVPQINFIHSTELEKAIINNNYLYKQAQATIQAQKSNVFYVASQLAPSINATAAYQDVANPGHTASTGSYSTVVYVNIPIFNAQTNAYSATRKARNDWKSSQLNLIGVAKKLKEEGGGLLASYKALALKVQFSKEAMGAAQLVYDGTIQEEEVGNKSMLDVLNAESRLTEAKMSYLNAKQSYANTAYHLKYTIGDLTAKSLGLKVDIFDPDVEFKKLSSRVIGF